MFEDSGDERETKGGLKVNQNFAAKFNERKKREELERARTKFGRNLEELEDSDNSSLPEDETGVLDNEEISMRVLDTIAKIRTKNPEIYNKGTKYFNEEDMEEGKRYLDQGQLGKREKKYDYRTMIRDAVKEGGIKEDDSEEEKEIDETPNEVQARIKKEFKKAAGEESDKEDDIFTVKVKSKQQVHDEEKEFEKFIEKQKKKSKEDSEQLQKVWGSKNKLNEEDQFLRKFLLTQGWIDDEDAEGGTTDFTHMVGEEKGRWEQLQEKVDQEDEQMDGEVDEYEEKINFRYEQPGGTRIQTYERMQEESLRQKDSHRAEKRKEKEARKADEKKQFRNEVEYLKQLKKEEINDKIKKLMKAGGIGSLRAEKTLTSMLEDNFNEENFDKQMNNVFDDQYYDEEDEEEEDLAKYVEEIEQNLDKTIAGDTKKDTELTQKPTKEDTADVDLKPNPNIPIIMKKKLTNEEANTIQAEMKDNLWWYCDSCHKGIQPLEARFDCMECDDYSECKKCADLRGHDHQMKKFIVPEGCFPPSDQEISNILGNFKACSRCEDKLDGTKVYFKSKENEEFLLCETCMYFSKKKKNKKLYERINPTSKDITKIMEEGDYHQLENEEGLLDNELTKMIDEYNKIDFEDVIAGGLKTRFKYVNVGEQDYNLDDDDMIFADDNLLNKYLSVKKLAPYREEDLTDKQKKRMKKMLSLVKASTEKNKQDITRMIELQKEEEYLKMMAKKNLKYKKKLDKFYEKKERIEHGIEEKAKQQEMRDGMKLTDMTYAEEPVAPEQSGVSTSRLKSYGL